VTKATTWPLLFSVWVGLLSYTVPITLIATTSSLDYVSVYEWLAIAFFALYQFVGTTVQLVYYYHVYMPMAPSLLFKSTSAKDTYSLKNYDSYNNYLTWNSALIRGLVITFLVILTSQDVHTIYPSTTVAHNVYDMCEPRVQNSLTKVNLDDSTTTTLGIPHICAQASGTLAVIAASGFNNVDSSINTQIPGYGVEGGSGDNSLSVTVSTACSTGAKALAENYFAFDSHHRFQAPGTFDPDLCCKTMEERNETQVALGCYGWAFTSESVSRFSADLETNKFGPAIEQLDLITVNVASDGSHSYVTAPNYGFTAHFNHLAQTSGSGPIDTIPYYNKSDTNTSSTVKGGRRSRRAQSYIPPTQSIIHQASGAMKFRVGKFAEL